LDLSAESWTRAKQRQTADQDPEISDSPANVHCHNFTPQSKVCGEFNSRL